MRKSVVILTILSVFMLLGQVQGAKVVLPENAKSNKIFLLKVVPDSEDSSIEITFDPSELQFMGSLQPTSDIQIVIDGNLEIKSSSGSLAEFYELKFSSSEKDTESVKICVKSGEVTEDCLVLFVKGENKNYSWLYLIGGIVLFFLAHSFWKFQKNSPAMMSTKSLFLNYEEIEKARKKYEGSTQKIEENSQASETTKLQEVASKKEEVSTEDANKVVVEEDEHEAPTQELPAVQEKEAHTDKKDKASKKEENSVLLKVTLEANGTTYEGEGNPLKIGRRKDNNLVISASEVSRAHAEVRLEGDQLLIKAVSSNVTRLNGKDVKEEKAMVTGDVLNLGGTDFVVVRAIVADE